MGISHRHADMLATNLRAQREREALADATATVEQFNARLKAKCAPWFWPTIGAALLTMHPWLRIACGGQAIVSGALR